MSLSEIIQIGSIVGSLLVLIGGAIWWCLQRYIRQLQRRNASLEDRIDKLDRTCQNLRADNVRLEEANKHRLEQIQQTTKESDELRHRFEHSTQQVIELRGTVARLDAERTQYQEQIARLGAEQSRHITEVRAALKERASLRGQAAQHQQELRTIQDSLSERTTQLTGTQERLAKEAQRATELEQQFHQRIADYQEAEEERDEQIRELQKQIAAYNEQINQIISQDERVWEKPVKEPVIQPLSQRRVPVIAVLNLKGGVGKTTITAHLGGMMAERGQKVLMIDADYQRNLSMLLASDRDRKMLHLEKRTLQDYLVGKTHTQETLRAAAHEVKGYKGCWVVTNSDAPVPVGNEEPEGTRPSSLEDTEMRLMAEWLFRPLSRDVRLLLRQALHDHTLHTKGYHCVLIDCPPRLSTACINALAAADFVLVPVLLDATSARSVPNLLRTLKRLRDDKLFPHLNLLGVVANQVRRMKGELLKPLKQVWNELPTACRVAWGQPVHLFPATIPHSLQFAIAAGMVNDPDREPRLALNNDEIHEAFSDLFVQIQESIQHESQQPATVSS